MFGHRTRARGDQPGPAKASTRNQASVRPGRGTDKSPRAQPYSKQGLQFGSLNPLGGYQPKSSDFGYSEWDFDWIYPLDAEDLTKQMWNDANSANCPLARHVDYMCRNLNKNRVKPQKILVSPIACKEEYVQWRLKVGQVLRSYNLLDVVCVLEENPKRLEREKNGLCFGSLVYFDTEGKLPRNRLNPHQITAFVDLAAAIGNNTKEMATNYLMQDNAVDLVMMLRALSARWGVESNVEQFNIGTKLNTENGTPILRLSRNG